MTFATVCLFPNATPVILWQACNSSHLTQLASMQTLLAGYAPPNKPSLPAVQQAMHYSPLCSASFSVVVVLFCTKNNLLSG